MTSKTAIAGLLALGITLPTVAAAGGDVYISLGVPVPVAPYHPGSAYYPVPAYHPAPHVHGPYCGHRYAIPHGHGHGHHGGYYHYRGGYYGHRYNPPGLQGYFRYDHGHHRGSSIRGYTLR